MFETSADILNITLSVSVAAVAFFICWGAFYLIMSVRKVFKVIEGVEDILREVKEGVIEIKEKLSSGAALVDLLGRGYKKVVEVKEKRAGGSAKKGGKKKGK